MCVCSIATENNRVRIVRGNLFIIMLWVYDSNYAAQRYVGSVNCLACTCVRARKHEETNIDFSTSWSSPCFVFRLVGFMQYVIVQMKSKQKSVSNPMHNIPGRLVVENR